MNMHSALGVPKVVKMVTIKQTKGVLIILVLISVSLNLSGCVEDTGNDYPKIASWLAKKDEIIESNKPYDLVMSGWFTPEEALAIKTSNPQVLLLAGLSLNWIWENEDWMTFLKTVASYGREEPLEIVESMYLRTPEGEKCGFGWASEEWGHEEIYAMDPRNADWVELITSFYQNVLLQPQHDGIIVDMVTERQWWCPEAITDEEWLSGTISIMQIIETMNSEDKLVIFNSGKGFSDIDAYQEFFDGFLIENFMGEQMGSTYEEGLQAADTGKQVIYAMDTDDTGVQDMNKMRLGLTLSLLNDNTYFTYDIGPRDHGQSWWFIEYDADLGNPLGPYYQKDNAYFRDFENGVVVSSPSTDITVSFTKEHVDVTSGFTSKEFTVEAGDGRIYLEKTE